MDILEIIRRLLLSTTTTHDEHYNIIATDRVLLGEVRQDLSNAKYFLEFAERIKGEVILNDALAYSAHGNERDFNGNLRSVTFGEKININSLILNSLGMNMHIFTEALGKIARLPNGQNQNILKQIFNGVAIDYSDISTFSGEQFTPDILLRFTNILLDNSGDKSNLDTILQNITEVRRQNPNIASECELIQNSINKINRITTFSRSLEFEANNTLRKSNKTTIPGEIIQDAYHGAMLEAIRDARSLSPITKTEIGESSLDNLRALQNKISNYDGIKPVVTSDDIEEFSRREVGKAITFLDVPDEKILKVYQGNIKPEIEFAIKSIFVTENIPTNIKANAVSFLLVLNRYITGNTYQSPVKDNRQINKFTAEDINLFLRLLPYSTIDNEYDAIKLFAESKIIVNGKTNGNGEVSAKGNPLIFDEFDRYKTVGEVHRNPASPEFQAKVSNYKQLVADVTEKFAAKGLDGEDYSEAKKAITEKLGHKIANGAKYNGKQQRAIDDFLRLLIGDLPLVQSRTGTPGERYKMETTDQYEKYKGDILEWQKRFPEGPVREKLDATLRKLEEDYNYFSKQKLILPADDLKKQFEESLKNGLGIVSDKDGKYKKFNDNLKDGDFDEIKIAIDYLNENLSGSLAETDDLPLQKFYADTETVLDMCSRTDMEAMFYTLNEGINSEPKPHPEIEDVLKQVANKIANRLVSQYPESSLSEYLVEHSKTNYQVEEGMEGKIVIPVDASAEKIKPEQIFPVDEETLHEERKEKKSRKGNIERSKERLAEFLADHKDNAKAVRYKRVTSNNNPALEVIITVEEKGDLVEYKRRLTCYGPRDQRTLENRVEKFRKNGTEPLPEKLPKGSKQVTQAAPEVTIILHPEPSPPPFNAEPLFPEPEPEPQVLVEEPVQPKKVAKPEIAPKTRTQTSYDPELSNFANQLNARTPGQKTPNNDSFALSIEDGNLFMSVFKTKTKIFPDYISLGPTTNIDTAIPLLNQIVIIAEEHQTTGFTLTSSNNNTPLKSQVADAENLFMDKKAYAYSIQVIDGALGSDKDFIVTTYKKNGKKLGTKTITSVLLVDDILFLTTELHARAQLQNGKIQQTTNDFISNDAPTEAEIDKAVADAEAQRNYLEQVEAEQKALAKATGETKKARSQPLRINEPRVSFRSADIAPVREGTATDQPEPSKPIPGNIGDNVTNSANNRNITGLAGATPGDNIPAQAAPTNPNLQPVQTQTIPPVVPATAGETAAETAPAQGDNASDSRPDIVNETPDGPPPSDDNPPSESNPPEEEVIEDTDDVDGTKEDDSDNPKKIVDDFLANSGDISIEDLIEDLAYQLAEDPDAVRNDPDFIKEWEKLSESEQTEIKNRAAEILAGTEPAGRTAPGGTVNDATEASLTEDIQQGKAPAPSTRTSPNTDPMPGTSIEEPPLDPEGQNFDRNGARERFVEDLARKLAANPKLIDDPDFLLDLNTGDGTLKDEVIARAAEITVIVNTIEITADDLGFTIEDTIEALAQTLASLDPSDPNYDTQEAFVENDITELSPEDQQKVRDRVTEIEMENAAKAYEELPDDDKARLKNGKDKLRERLLGIKPDTGRPDAGNDDLTPGHDTDADGNRSGDDHINPNPDDTIVDYQRPNIGEPIQQQGDVMKPQISGETKAQVADITSTAGTSATDGQNTPPISSSSASVSRIEITGNRASGSSSGVAGTTLGVMGVIEQSRKLKLDEGAGKLGGKTQLLYSQTALGLNVTAVGMGVVTMVDDINILRRSLSTTTNLTQLSTAGTLRYLGPAGIIVSGIAAGFEATAATEANDAYRATDAVARFAGGTIAGLGTGYVSSGAITVLAAAGVTPPGLIIAGVVFGLYTVYNTIEGSNAASYIAQENIAPQWQKQYDDEAKRKAEETGKQIQKIADEYESSRVALNNFVDAHNDLINACKGNNIAKIQRAQKDYNTAYKALEQNNGLEAEDINFLNDLKENLLLAEYRERVRVIPAGENHAENRRNRDENHGNIISSLNQVGTLIQAGENLNNAAFTSDLVQGRKQNYKTISQASDDRIGQIKANKKQQEFANSLHEIYFGKKSEEPENKGLASTFDNIAKEESARNTIITKFRNGENISSKDMEAFKQEVNEYRQAQIADMTRLLEAEKNLLALKEQQIKDAKKDRYYAGYVNPSNGQDGNLTAIDKMLAEIANYKQLIARTNNVTNTTFTVLNEYVALNEVLKTRPEELSPDLKGGIELSISSAKDVINQDIINIPEFQGLASEINTAKTQVQQNAENLNTFIVNISEVEKQLTLNESQAEAKEEKDKAEAAREEAVTEIKYTDAQLAEMRGEIFSRILMFENGVSVMMDKQGKVSAYVSADGVQTMFLKPEERPLLGDRFGNVTSKVSQETEYPLVLITADNRGNSILTNIGEPYQANKEQDKTFFRLVDNKTFKKAENELGEKYENNPLPMNIETFAALNLQAINEATKGLQEFIQTAHNSDGIDISEKESIDAQIKEINAKLALNLTLEQNGNNYQLTNKMPKVKDPLSDGVSK